MYRDYSKFDPIGFQSDIQNYFAGDSKACLAFENFNYIVEELMNKHAPIKQKYLGANDAPFMLKTLRKAIMLQKQLRNKNNSLENWKAYKKQQEKCIKILRQVKALYYGNLDMISLYYNKKFLGTIQALFTEKVQTTQSTTLI